MSKTRLIFATGNQGKVNEFKQMLGDEYEILSMKDIGVDIDIEENGTSFEENAVIKAKAVMEVTGEMVLADDSGFEVDALNGEPGIYSARYMGENTPYSVKNAELIRRCEGVPDEKRGARFVCVIACAYPDGTVDTAKGVSRQEKTDLATILFFICRREDAPPENWSRKRKIRSATEVLPLPRW